jgi:hypothetical protein
LERQDYLPGWRESRLWWMPAAATPATSGVTEDITILSLEERDGWIAEHADGGLPSQSWEYAWGLSASGAAPKLAVVRAGGGRMLMPFVERHWLGTTDIATSFGISGASIIGNCGAPLALWHKFATARGWIAGYIQLAISVNLDEVGFPGQLVTNNMVFVLDLDRLTLTSCSQAIRRKIRRAQKSNTTLVEDRCVLVTALKRLYPEAMQRRGAAPHFFFAPETLERWACSHGAMILGARIGCSIEAVYLCLVAGRHAEFHLLACSESGRGLAAWVIWNGIQHLQDRGVTSLNITGGMRPGDGLYRFKGGFNGVPTPRCALHQVYDQVQYDELCRQSGTPSRSDWFPAYRAVR